MNPEGPKRIDWKNESKLPERNIPGNAEYSSRKDRVVDIHRLIKLTEGYPVLKMPLAVYMHRLNIDCWKDRDEKTFTPRTLIDIIKEHGFENAIELYPQYKSHIKKIERANYSFPLHVQNEWVINGTHRISKLVLERELGITIQDFITVKDLHDVPRESLTISDLMKEEDPDSWYFEDEAMIEKDFSN